MEAMLMGDSDDSDSDDSVQVVAGGTVPTSAAAAIPIATPLPAPVPIATIQQQPTRTIQPVRTPMNISAHVPVATPLSQPIPVSRPVPVNVPVGVSVGVGVSVSVSVPQPAAVPTRTIQHQVPIVRNPPPSVQTLPPSTKPGKGYGQGSAPGSRPVPAPIPVAIPVSVPTPVPTIRTPTNSQMSHGTRNIISTKPPPQMMSRITVARPVGIPPASNPISSMTKQQAQQAKLKELYNNVAPPVSKPSTYNASINTASTSTAPSLPTGAFEPTPLKVMQAQTTHRQQQHQQQQQQQQQHQRQPANIHHPMHNHNRTDRQPPGHHNRMQPTSGQPGRVANVGRPGQVPINTAQPSSQPRARYPQTSSSAPPNSSASEQKSRKEQFLMFTRVLMKYLEQKDQKMHSRAKEVIRDCAKKNKEGNPAFSSLSASMQSHLKQLVGQIYWKKAEEYLKQYMTQQYAKNKNMPLEEAKKKAAEMAESAASPLSLELPISRSRPHGGNQGMQMEQQRRQQHASVAPNMNPNPTPTIPNKKFHHPKPKEQRSQVVPEVHAHAPVPPTKKIKKKPSSAPKSSGKKKGATDANVGRVPTPTTKKKTKPKKNTSAPTASAAATTLKGGAKPSSELARPKHLKVNPPKEYSETMQMLDHVVDYNVSSCMVILGNDSKNKNEVNISEEQKKMLYHDFGITNIGPRKGLYSGQGKEASAVRAPPSKSKWKPSKPQPTALALPSYLKGWDERNLISTRAAWSKLRLLEEEEQKLGDISLPSIPINKMNSTTTTTVPERAQSTSNNSVTPPTVHQEKSTTVSENEWFNEEQAEEDQTLALISEATQHFIKTILEGAMSCASKRQNLDGIRLWHQQHAAAAIKAEEKAKGVSSGKVKDPPLHLRLGCDTKRQYALVQGNAAKTYQRLEEALSRQAPTEFNAVTMYNATSMMELSKIPKISGAAKSASYNAKRIFEIHGGKESSDPPLGRVPKKAKIMVDDFRSCLKEPAFAMSRKGVASSAFA